MTEPLIIFIELLDEGVETWREARAISLPNGLFKVLAPADYNPADEAWEFLPGSAVRLVVSKNYMGQQGLLARHPDPEAIRVTVQSAEKFAPTLRDTYALPKKGGLYELLPTPHYSPAQLWKFPPGSLVRLQPIHNTELGTTTLLAVAA